MTWTQRLKRVFNIDIEICSECGGTVKVIACIEDPAVIKKIFTHLKGQAAPEPAGLLPSVRAPRLSACNARDGQWVCSTDAQKPMIQLKLRLRRSRRASAGLMAGIARKAAGERVYFSVMAAVCGQEFVIMQD